LNKKITAYFNAAKNDCDLKLMPGDELRLRYLGDMQKPWSGVGHVIKVTIKNESYSASHKKLREYGI
jgi:regulator of nonsense transcripts 1